MLDNKIMNALTFLADLAILNILYLVSCMGIITIGAAQSGLYTGIRVLLDKDDGTPVSRAFLRGFRSGFGKITVLFCLLGVLLALLVMALLSMMGYQSEGASAPVYLAPVAMFLCMMLMSMLTIFHSRFDCGFFQLLKNTFIGMMAFPLQTAALTIFVWLPVGVALVSLQTFVKLTPLWIIIYYSLAAMMGVGLMQRPFKKVESLFSAPKEEA